MGLQPLEMPQVRDWTWTGHAVVRGDCDVLLVEAGPIGPANDLVVQRACILDHMSVAAVQ